MAEKEGDDERGRRVMELSPNQIKHVADGLDAPTLFAEDIRGTMISQGVAKLNLVENRVNALTGEVVLRHVATIVIPIHAMKTWGEYLVKTAAEHADGE